METVILDFQKDVIEASKTTPIVVDFWAEWCGPCKMLTPVLENLASEANDTWKLLKVDTEEHQELSVEYGISGIPAVKMFSGGKIIAEFVGALPEDQVRSWLEKNIPTESRKLFEEAKKVLADGDKSKAQNLFEQVINAEPNNFEARILLAELIFEPDGEKALDLVKDVPEANPLYKNAQAIQTLSRLLNSFESISKQAQESDLLPAARGTDHRRRRSVEPPGRTLDRARRRRRRRRGPGALRDPRNDRTGKHREKQLDGRHPTVQRGRGSPVRVSRGRALDRHHTLNGVPRGVQSAARRSTVRCD